MTDQIASQHYVDSLFFGLEETFTTVRGGYLDPGTSLFETLATIDAVEASKPVSACCASIAAQVFHVRFYIDNIEQWMNSTPPKDVDWNSSWTTVTTVTEDEWTALIGELRASYDRVRETMKSYDAWDNQDRLGGSLMLLVHTAFHLGQIRQSLCTIKTCMP